MKYRREFLTSCVPFLPALAMTNLLAEDRKLGVRSGATEIGNSNDARLPHFPAKAKNCIFFFMWGGPSQVDLFDPKPTLAKYDGQPIPDSITNQVNFAFTKKETARLQASPFKFKTYDDSGIPFSELLPNLGARAHRLSLLKAMHTDSFNHRPSQIFLNTGSTRMGRPGVGSWVNYGLGSESRDLPGFVVLRSGEDVEGGTSNWSSGFLPSEYQGIAMHREGPPILNLTNPEDLSPTAHHLSLDTSAKLNRIRKSQTGDPETIVRIANYELAYRMQSAAPELCDLSQETQATNRAYGLDRADPEEHAFAKNCLLARRLVERGVRFVNIYFGDWDAHVDLPSKYKSLCRTVDQPIAALLDDLQQRGLLDSTLVVWAGEFGRTPVGDNRMPDAMTSGRDHHPTAFTSWMAGGGVKGGFTYGETDELGWAPISSAMHVNDFHATLLHLFGLDHKQLTYHFQGRDFRLTDVAGKVAHEIIA